MAWYFVNPHCRAPLDANCGHILLTVQADEALSEGDVLTTTAEEEEIRALRAKFAYDVEAEAERMRGKSALLSSILGGANTLLGAGTTLYTQGRKP